MTIGRGYTEIYDRIADARLILISSDDEKWSAEKRANRSMALDDIESDLSSPSPKSGFSIVRSLDASGLIEGQIAESLLKVSHELQRNGINRYL